MELALLLPYMVTEREKMWHLSVFFPPNEPAEKHREKATALDFPWGEYK